MSAEEANKAPERDEATEERKTPPSSTMLNELVPPPGTVYYSLRTYSLMNNQKMGASEKFGRVTWHIDAYTYASGAVSPADPDFASKGGMIYIVMIHRGSVTIDDDFDADVWDRMTFQISLRQSNLTPLLHLPSTGSETPSGDNNNYTINYGQEMQLLANQGNEAISFEAKYQEDFSRVLATQTGSTAGDIHFGIYTIDESSKHRTTDLFGLTVLTHSDPSQFPLSPGFNFDIDGDEHWASGRPFSLGLGF
ncbi:hypothetical protein EYR36_009023 [Pleurotus pulmonarius]|nr:hypothetical protein EYR36_009023 [Pleurotus pulmonarius]